MKKQFKLGQKVLWIVNDFDGKHVIHATISEVHLDYCIAKTEDNMTLWIDSDNEMVFFDFDIIMNISSIGGL